MATLEYTALALVVSAALVVGGAATDATALPGAVGAQLRKAYCLVAGGDCLARGGPRPCVVSSRSKLAEYRVAIAVVRLRDGRIVVREELSDGTYRVSVQQATGGGAGVQFGLHAQLFGRAVEGNVDAEAAGSVGYERSFVVRDKVTSERLIERLDEDDAPVAGAVAGVVRFLRDTGHEGEAARTVYVSTHGEATAALRALGLGPRVAALRHVTGSVRIDQRTGDRTVGLRLGGESMATLGMSLAQLGGSTISSTSAELILDAQRRPRELVLRASGGVHGEGKVLSHEVAGSDRREMQARLDLTDPVARELTDRLLGGDVGAAHGLAERLADRARLDVRHFATTRDGRSVGGKLMGVGGQRITTTETARLVAAAGREPGMGWSRRLDCVPAA
jgi:hypothetical protein